MKFDELPEQVKKFNARYKSLAIILEQILQEFFGGDFAFNSFVYYKRSLDQTYADDGNTPVPATKYKMLIVIPLWRKSVEEYQEWNDRYHNGGHSAIYITSEVLFRDSDEKFKYGNWEITVAPLINDPQRRNNSHRIDYSTCSYYSDKLPYFGGELSLARLLRIVQLTQTEVVLMKQANVLFEKYLKETE